MNLLPARVSHANAESCCDRQRGRQMYRCDLISESDAEESDIDRESCLEYECEHDLDSIDRPWRLQGRRAVNFTIFLLK